MAFQYGNVTIGTSPTLICSTDRMTDVYLDVHNGQVAVGDSAVTASSGLPLMNSDPPIALKVYGDLYGVVSSGTEQVNFYFSHSEA